MKCNIHDFRWLREPAAFTMSDEKVEIVTKPHTDLWQRTYYHFRNDNAPVLQMETEEKFFSFVVKTSFEESHHRGTAQGGPGLRADRQDRHAQPYHVPQRQGAGSGGKRRTARADRCHRSRRQGRSCPRQHLHCAVTKNPVIKNSRPEWTAVFCFSDTTAIFLLPSGRPQRQERRSLPGNHPSDRRKGSGSAEKNEIK